MGEAAMEAAPGAIPGSLRLGALGRDRAGRAAGIGSLEHDPGFLLGSNRGREQGDHHDEQAARRRQRPSGVGGRGEGLTQDPGRSGREA